MIDNNNSNKTKFDLEERTYLFAKVCRDFCKSLDKDIINIKYIDQFIRSSGSVAANYIEANEALSKKDFFHRVRICRKEAKECILWLKLIETKNPDQEQARLKLLDEAEQLMKIFGAILEKEKK